jgi:hypothetical protein
MMWELILCWQHGNWNLLNNTKSTKSALTFPCHLPEDCETVAKLEQWAKIDHIPQFVALRIASHLCHTLVLRF